MPSSRLVWLGGLAALIGGSLFVVSDLLILAEDPEDPIRTVTSASYAVSKGLGLLAGVLLQGGLIGLYARQSEQVGLLGFAGFLVAFIGQALVICVYWFRVFVETPIAQLVPELYEAGLLGAGLTGFGILLPYGLYALGWFLFGMATFRARVYPRAAAVLLMVGAVPIAFPLSPVIGALGGAVFDVAVAWLGYSLLSDRGEPVQQPARVR